MVLQGFDLSTGRQKDFCEFEASLGYIVSQFQANLGYMVRL